MIGEIEIEGKMENPVYENNNSSDSSTESTHENQNYISIPEFYDGRSIFITGGTGFMGKVSKFQLKFVSLLMKFIVGSSRKATSILSWNQKHLPFNQTKARTRNHITFRGTFKWTTL